MPKILIVDDDTMLSSNVSSVLKEEGFTVETANCGKDGLQLMKGFHFDLVILDWSMPDMTGLEVCRQYRSEGGDCAVIFLTGNSDEHAKIDGLDSGADDYVCKPFSMRELLARVNSLLRRPRQLFTDSINRADVTLVLSQRQIHSLGKTVSLSQKETSIVELLFKNPGQIFSSQKLFELLWPADCDSSEQTVRVHVKGIRNKLTSSGIADFIQSAKGGGWFVS